MNDYHKWHAEVYGQDNPEGDAHGWIQWKGTTVCMDVHCSCGESTHIDEDFLYFLECGACGKKYAVGQNVKLIPLTDEQAKYPEGTAVGFMKSHGDDF